MQLIVYKKRHKIKISHSTKASISIIIFGFYGLKSMKYGVLKLAQLEVIRRILTKALKRSAKIYIRVFFYFPITKKPLLTRMGKGVGAIKEWVCIIKKGSIILEINSLSKNAIKDAFFLINNKSSIPLALVFRNISMLA